MLVGVTAVLLVACRPPSEKELDDADDLALEALLNSRPFSAPTGPAPAPGIYALGLDTGRDGVMYVPVGYRHDRPAPMILVLHGAGGSGRMALDPFLGLADVAGLVLVAPDSRGSTWDLIEEWYGADVLFVDQALERVFERCAVDIDRIAIAGFSDGASYALSLGLTNGDLFSHAIAFTPGFVAPADHRGQLRLFVSHGTKDLVLTIDETSRKIVPQARQAGFDVTYREFDGGARGAGGGGPGGGHVVDGAVDALQSRRRARRRARSSSVSP